MRYLYLTIFFFLTLNTAFGKENRDLETLYYKCKIWGFVKYFSPSTNEIDDDLFLIVNNIISVDSFVQKNYSVQFRNTKNAEIVSNYCKVDHRWVADCPLTSEHTKELMQQMSKNRIVNYMYKNRKKGILNEKTYTQFENIDFNLAVLGVSRLWNFLNYYYPHICYVNNWNETLKNSLIVILGDYDNSKYKKALFVISDALRDTHSEFESYGLRNTYIDTLYCLPYNFLKLKNDLLVVNKNFKDNNPLQISDTILKVNGEKPNYYILKENLMPYIIENRENYIIEVKRGKDNITFELNKDQLTSINEWFTYNMNTKNYIDFTKFNSLYIDVNNVSSQNEVKEIRKQLNQYSNYVIDLRGYPISNYVNKVVKYFYKNGKHTTYGLIYPIKNNPGMFKDKSVMSAGGVIGNKKVYVLVNEFTNSWSETLCIELLNNPNVRFIGSNTANALGGMEYSLILPGEIKFNTSNIGTCTSEIKTLYPLGIPIDKFVLDENKLVGEIEEILKNDSAFINRNK